MTRKEQIAKAISENYDLHKGNSMAFRNGILWADEHPDVNTANMLAYLAGVRDTIDKACQWLTAELCYGATGATLFNNETETEKFINRFKQAMQQ